MAEWRHDQAEGLRRIFGARRSRSVAVFAGSAGTGATTCVLNVAAAAAQQGRRVVAIDENRERNISELLGLRPRSDLQEVLEGRCGLANVSVQASGGLTVISAADAACAALNADGRARARALKTFRKLTDAADVVLVDARSAAEPSVLAGAAEDVVIVVSASSTSITGGYTVLKRMSRTCGNKHFHLLVNCVEDETVAKRVHANMASVANRHLALELDYIGAVPRAAAVAESARCFVASPRSRSLARASQHSRTHAAAILESSAAQDCFTRLDNFMQRAIYGNLAVGAGV